MSDPEAPKIEFPCEDYLIKIMGVAGGGFREAALNIIEKHAPGFDASRVKVKPSSAGKYESITVYITATGEPQLKAIFEDLKRLPEMRMVL